MSRMGIGLTANQNSIPRELVYDGMKCLRVIWTLSLSFIGCDVPEGIRAVC